MVCTRFDACSNVASEEDQAVCNKALVRELQPCNHVVLFYIYFFSSIFAQWIDSQVSLTQWLPYKKCIVEYQQSYSFQGQ